MLVFSKEKIYYIIASMLYNVYQLFIIIITARIIDTTAVGIIAFAFAVCAPVYMFFDFRLQFIILSDSKNNNNFNFYFCARFLTCIISIIIICIISLLVRQSNETKWVIIFIGLFKFFESFGEIFLAQKQREFSLRETFLSKWIRTGVGFLSFLFSLLFTKSIFFGSLALFVSSLLVFIFYEKKTSKIGPNFNTKDFFPEAFFMVKKYYYLGFVSLLASLSSNVPRYSLSYYWDMQEVGIYSILSYLSMGMVLFVTTSFQPFIPRISEFIRRREIEKLHFIMKRFLTLFVLFGIIVLFSLTILGTKIFEIILNNRIFISRPMIFIIILGGIFNYISLIILYTLTAANLLKQQIYFYIGDIFIVGISSYLLIPSCSVLGGCIVYLIVSVYHTVCGILYIYYRREYFKYI